MQSIEEIHDNILVIHCRVFLVQYWQTHMLLGYHLLICQSCSIFDTGPNLLIVLISYLHSCMSSKQTDSAIWHCFFSLSKAVVRSILQHQYFFRVFLFFLVTTILPLLPLFICSQDFCSPCYFCFGVGVPSLLLLLIADNTTFISTG